MNVYVTAYSVGHFISALLALTIGMYLLTMRRKTLESYCIIFFLLTFGIARACGFILDSVLDARVSHTVFFLRVMMAGGIFLLAFAYRFQKPMFHRESVIVLSAFGAYFLFAYIVYAARTAAAEPYFDFIFHSYRYSDAGSRGQYISIANALLYAWTAIVFLRKAVLQDMHGTRENRVLYAAARTIFRPGKGRASRSFMIVTLIPLAMGLMYVLALRDVIAFADYELIVSIGSMVFMLFLTIVFINNAAQPSTLAFKIIVIPLTAALTVVGCIAIPLTSSMEGMYQRKAKKSSAVTSSYLALADGHLPADVRYIVRSPGTGRYFRNVYTAESEPDIAAAINGGAGSATTNKGVVFRSFSTREPASFYIGREITNGADVHEMGMSYVEYRAYINGGIGYLIIIAVLIAAVIIVFFPLFFRQSVLGPLTRILSALNAFEAGKRDVPLNITSEDEFGRIASAFTSMTKRIQRTMNELVISRKALADYNEKLEATVTDRTKELIAVNRNLREEIEARRNAEDMLERVVQSDFLDLEKHPEVLAPYGLTKREEQILIDLLNGASNRDIADKYGIAEPTAKVHSISIYRKFGVNSKSKLIKKLLSAL